jgi:peptidoglycan DL-endopeptidase LytF
METLAYLYAAQEYEYPEEKEIDLKWVNRAAITLLGVACSTGLVNLGGAAQALGMYYCGDSGADVARLQDLLRNAGYFPNASTGYFGEVTKAAVEDFQTAKGLAVDGVAGDQTLKALDSSLRATPAIAVTSVTMVTPIASVTPVATTPNITPPAATTPTATAPTATTPAVTTPIATRPGTVSSGDLGFGDSGVSVTRLQDLLRRAGYFPSPSTGFYGAATREAVKRFQQANRISADGFAGRGTIAALESAPAASNAASPNANTTRPVTNVISTNAANNTAANPVRPVAIARVLQPGDSGADVIALQQRLTDLRFYTGPVTGVYGELTEGAVRDFQQARNLEIDGVVGARSLAALR